MIGAAKGGRQATSISIFKINIIPPGERIRPGHFEKAEDRKKGRYADNEIDELPELGPRSHCVNG